MWNLHLFNEFCSKKSVVLASIFSYTVFHRVSAGSSTRRQAGFPGFRKGEAAKSCRVLSETLQKLLELGDDLCVHCLHEGLEALLSQ